MSDHEDRRTSDRAALTRRAALGMAGALGAAAALRSSGRPAAPAAATPCIVTPAETEGPFFVDTRLNRSDVTAGTTRAGVVRATPLHLRIAVYKANGGACTPLPGANVDLWHTDALGIYSGVRELGTAGQTFLRGYQVTGRDGSASFGTVYPGWYAGRAVHIHFKVRTAATAENRAYEFTSQLFFDEAQTDAVFATAPYNTRGPRDMTNARDEFFSRLLVVPLRTSPRRGYAGTFSVGLNIG